MSWFNMFRGRGYELVSDIDSDRYAPEEQLISPQYDIPRRAFPKKEIVWGIVMLVLGLVLVGLGLLVHFEHWGNSVPGSAAGFLGLGILVLIPGAYASTIAAGAWLKAPGFKFEMMPQMARSA